MRSLKLSCILVLATLRAATLLLALIFCERVWRWSTRPVDDVQLCIKLTVSVVKAGECCGAGYTSHGVT